MCSELTGTDSRQPLTRSGTGGLVSWSGEDLAFPLEPGDVALLIVG